MGAYTKGMSHFFPWLCLPNDVVRRREQRMAGWSLGARDRPRAKLDEHNLLKIASERAQPQVHYSPPKQRAGVNGPQSQSTMRPAKLSRSFLPYPMSVYQQIALGRRYPIRNPRRVPDALVYQQRTIGQRCPPSSRPRAPGSEGQGTNRPHYPSCASASERQYTARAIPFPIVPVSAREVLRDTPADVA